MIAAISAGGGPEIETHAGIRWRRWGDSAKPAVLLLHPIATTGSIWEAQAATWATRYHVAAIDLPGHGDSASLAPGADMADYAAAIVASLRSASIERVAVVGLSIGSMIAQRLAADHPDLVDSVVLANGAAVMPPVGAQAWGERIADARTHGMASLRAAMLGRWFTPDFLHDAPDTVAAIGAMIDATPVEGFVAAADAIARLDNREALAQIACPALVVAGLFDSAAPPEVVEPIAAAIPGARYLALPAAHLANVEAAPRFTEEVGAFLDATVRVVA